MTTTTVNVKFDSGGVDVDPLVATYIAKEREKYDSQIDDLTKKKDDLYQQFLETQKELDTTKGKLEAANTKLSEAEKIDHSGEISARLDTWNAVLPSIKEKDPNFDADYNLSVPQIQRIYLEKVRGQANLDSQPDQFIGGLYSGLKPNSKQDAIAKSHAQFDSLNNRGKTIFDSESNAEKARRKAIEAKENRYKNLEVVK